MNTVPTNFNTLYPESNQVPTVASNFTTVLLQQNKINQQDLDNAKVAAVNEGKRIEDILMSQGKVSEVDIYKAKAVSGGFKYIDIADRQIPIDVLNKISKDVAAKHLAVPFQEENGKIQIALSDPGDLQKVKFLQIVIGKPVEVYIAPPSQIQLVIDKQYAARITTEVEEALEDVGDIIELSEQKLKSEDITSENLDSAPVSRIVNMILEYAVRYKSSDVHIEPRENKVVVRFRMSGVLVEKLTIPKKLSAPLVSRIKILSNLKIDEHRLPQDGRFQIKVGNIYFDLRVSIMPSIYGEKIVMRLLARGGADMRLEDSGLRGYAYRAYIDGLKKTEGILLVTGPTGSGKTQTLASSLNILNNPGVNILTLEDPVEIRVDGVTQVQVNSDIGLTFASGLRAFLRQDPDIIMVGEIRDSETASLAVQAALTGHLVLATLHTNSSAGAIPRLLDMGVENFLLASTINVVIAQRLTRKICNNCREAYIANPQEVQQLESILSSIKGFDLYKYPPRRNAEGQIIENDKKEVILYKGKGCSTCNGNGYVGRVGIFEALIVNDKISRLIMEQRSAYEVENQAREDGMITMIQDGFLKALEGVTTLPEVLRVVK